MGKIVLASSSPRRRNIMANQTNYDFRVIPSPYEEILTSADFYYEKIENLAYQKALAVVPLVKEDSLIIGVDTVVVLDGQILGKPKGFDGAFEMLKKLSGKKHLVVTSIVVIDSKTLKTKTVSTTSEVVFEGLTDEMITSYLKNFEPFDKAGSYGIQEMPDGYIKHFSGSLENVIGLCPKALSLLLNSF